MNTIRLTDTGQDGGQRAAGIPAGVRARSRVVRRSKVAKFRDVETEGEPRFIA
jgi:hypothetical protein